MEKQKRWQLLLILAVIVLTIYNILPTVFYYSKPLKKPIGEQEATQVAKGIIERVNNLEDYTLSWLKAQSKNLKLKPLEIKLDRENPRLAYVTFKTAKDANFFAQTLRVAGAMIPFVPAQLNPDPRSFEPEATTVIVQRRIGIHLDPKDSASYFHYIPKEDASGNITPVYRELIVDRALQLAQGFGGESESAKILTHLSDDPQNNPYNEQVMRLARQIVDYENAFGDASPITQRFFASFSQSNQANKDGPIHQFTARLESLSKFLTTQINTLHEEQKSLKAQGEFLPLEKQQKLEIYESQKNTIQAASLIVRRNASTFLKGEAPLSIENLQNTLLSTPLPASKVQTIDFGQRNPFVKALEIDWNKDIVDIILHPDVISIRSTPAQGEMQALQGEKLNQLLFNEIAKVARSTQETISPALYNFTVQLNHLTNSSSLLTMDLGKLAKLQTASILESIKDSWNSTQSEFSPQNFPVSDYNSYTKLSAADQKFGVVVYSPASDEPVEGFRKGSIYVIVKGFTPLLKKMREHPQSEQSKDFEASLLTFSNLLRQNGFIGYFGAESDLPQNFKDDFIFELPDFSAYLIAATREDFSVKGSKQYAVLEFTNVEQRILTDNKIDTRIHEDLVKWRDEYQAAQVNLDKSVRYEVPPPVHNVYWDNLKLSTVKYFRGDDRKILRWGLDLSGGKTVRIGLKDQNMQTISNEDDLRQAINEIYQRVNRLGVSEVGIRREGSTIVLDFPGSQELSAADLLQASAMYFHIVNEKFSAKNPLLSEAVTTFLEEVWNEAVITHRQDPASINEIAWQHLGGDPENPGEFHPLTAHAQLLYDNGLRLAGPKSPPRSSAFDDTLSMVTLFRGSDFKDWQGQTNPLLFVFRNYALEGSNLADVHTGYDSSEGNVLNFSVRSSYINKNGDKVNPREDFYAWTSQFSEEKVAGTPKEAFSRGNGWRMAVILNGTVINAPTLNASLKDSARISGHFSQREVNQLAADLKAGSLSYTPYILSEENVSPDLGTKQRNQGIVAAGIGLLLVLGVMCAYYRFGGVVASVAVLINLLIIWGVLQNLGAAITMAGIAGIILTVGMSVDANVLVFERIREEFAISKRLPSAIAAGYRKAFSAIIDSNLTTIIAAIILLNFDSGPVKGFALNLIIGIIASMFTSLFMTRYFFAGWVQNPKNTTLHMSKFFGETTFNFLSKAKFALISSLVIVVISLGFIALEGKSILGMDFTGGYSLTVDLQEQPNVDYKEKATHAFVAAGASQSDFQIQELNKPNQLRIQLGMGMEQPGKPFYMIDQKEIPEHSLFTYQEYPRIEWIVMALQNQGLNLNPNSLSDLNLHWTEMSGQLSDAMRNNALLGLSLALVCILIYITFRFEFKYAISATLGLVHDLLITLGVVAILHFFFESVQIDLTVIAALMTTIGYSLNDTIIIFDRIREDLRLMRKQNFKDIVNHALNATLSRTVMTSGTTLLVLLALVLFGGRSLFNFSLIMTIGIAIGTLSSLFVAAPLLLYFHNKEEARRNAASSHPKNA